MNKLSHNTYFSGALAFLPIASMFPFLFIYFLIYSLRAKTVPKDKRVLWVMLILLLGFLVFPFFSYWYVLKPDKDNYY